MTTRSAFPDGDVAAGRFQPRCRIVEHVPAAFAGELRLALVEFCQLFQELFPFAEIEIARKIGRRRIEVPASNDMDEVDFGAELLGRQGGIVDDTRRIGRAVDECDDIRQDRCPPSAGFSLSSVRVHALQGVGFVGDAEAVDQRAARLVETDDVDIRAFPAELQNGAIEGADAREIPDMGA